MNSLLSLIPAQHMQELMALPQIAPLPDDQKKGAVDKLIDEILGRILDRISASLTEQDLVKVEQLAGGQNANSDAIRYFLLTKVPNLDAIIQEEVSKTPTEN